MNDKANKGERATPSQTDPVAMFGKAFAYWDGRAKATDKFGQPLGGLRAEGSTFSTSRPETRYLRIAAPLQRSPVMASSRPCGLICMTPAKLPALICPFSPH